MKPNRIIRHGPPNEYDQASQGSECWIITDMGADIYLQKSPDEEKPDWMYMQTIKPEDIDWTDI